MSLPVQSMQMRNSGFSYPSFQDFSEKSAFPFISSHTKQAQSFSIAIT